MSTGKIDPTTDNEMLFIGSRTNLLAYGIIPLLLTVLDVDRNKDIFDKEVSDGVSCLAFGSFSSSSGQPLIIAGGNCSLTGFDLAGDEIYWNVTSGNTSTL